MAIFLRVLSFLLIAFILYGIIFIRKTPWKKKHTRLLYIAGGFFLIFLLTFIPFSNSTAKSKKSAKTTETTTAKTLTKEEKEQAEKKEKQVTILNGWEKRIRESQGKVDIALYDPTLDLTLHYTNGDENEIFHTASIIKVSVLVGTLKNQGNKGTIPQATETRLMNMIEHSNNDATTYLIKHSLGGYQGLNQLFNQLEMKHTKANAAWGVTTTTASDQIELLKSLFYKEDFLSDTDRQLAKKLMGNVEQDQAWGISKDAPQVALKNGWLTLDTDGWIINSIGNVYDEQTNPKGYLLAVLTKGEKNKDAGVALIEDLAKIAKDNLMPEKDSEKTTESSTKDSIKE